MTQEIDLQSKVVVENTKSSVGSLKSVNNRYLKSMGNEDKINSEELLKL